jgi:hypothetical protein
MNYDQMRAYADQIERQTSAEVALASRWMDEVHLRVAHQLLRKIRHRVPRRLRKRLCSFGSIRMVRTMDIVAKASGYA